jgi:hypothetical protein
MNAKGRELEGMLKRIKDKNEDRSGSRAYSKGVSVCFYQHAHETPYSIFGLEGVVCLPSLKL